MTRDVRRFNHSFRCGRGVALIGLLIGAMLFRVWQKVEVAAIDRQYWEAQQMMDELGHERTKLMAGIAFKKKLEMIEHVAVGQIGMVYARGSEAVAGHWTAKDID